MKVTSQGLAQGLFSHPNFGNQVRVEQSGNEVRIILVCGDEKRAESFATRIVNDLKSGKMQLTIGGKVSKVEES